MGEEIILVLQYRKKKLYMNLFHVNIVKTTSKTLKYNICFDEILKYLRYVK